MQLTGLYPFYVPIVTLPGLPVVVCGFLPVYFLGLVYKFLLFVARPFYGLGDYIHLKGGPSTLWTVNILTLQVIHPLCGLCKYSHPVGDPSTLWTL